MEREKGGRWAGENSIWKAKNGNGQTVWHSHKTGDIKDWNHLRMLGG